MTASNGKVTLNSVVWQLSSEHWFRVLLTLQMGFDGHDNATDLQKLNPCARDVDNCN